MIISEKQIMQLIQNTNFLLAIGDSTMMAYFHTKQAIRLMAPKIMDLIIDIRDQQSEELKVIE